MIVERDKFGKLQFKRAFNTQACEQLNAWLAGFESILKRMVPGNFDWFLHVMLYYHTRFFIKRKEKQTKAAANKQEQEEQEEEEEEEEEEDKEDEEDEYEEYEYEYE